MRETPSDDNIRPPVVETPPYVERFELLQHPEAESRELITAFQQFLEDTRTALENADLVQTLFSEQHLPAAPVVHPQHPTTNEQMLTNLDQKWLLESFDHVSLSARAENLDLNRGKKLPFTFSRIEVPPTRESHKMIPVLYIGGMAHTHHFWRPLAASLSGTGHYSVFLDLDKQANPDITSLRLNDYVRLYEQALKDIIANMDQKPLIVAHSQGTLIGARLAQDHPDKIQGLVQMSALPPTGIIPQTLNYLNHHPRTFIQSLLKAIFKKEGVRNFFNTQQIIHDFFFSVAISNDNRDRYLAEVMGDDSFWTYLDACLLGRHWPFFNKSLPSKTPITVPHIMIHGSLDTLNNEKYARKAARIYGTGEEDFYLIEGAAHDCDIHTDDTQNDLGWRAAPLIINRFSDSLRTASRNG